MKSTFVSVKKVLKGGLLSIGQHLTTIASIVEAKPTEDIDRQWNDDTPQLEVTFQSEEGSIKKWYNLAGYKSKSDYPTGVAPKGFEFRSSANGDENYLVNIKTGMRVQDEEKTATAEKIFCELANDAGIAEGEGFGISDLIGKQIGVNVRDNNKGGVEVHYTMPASRVQVSEDAQA